MAMHTIPTAGAFVGIAQVDFPQPSAFVKKSRIHGTNRTEYPDTVRPSRVAPSGAAAVTASQKAILVEG